MTLIWHILELAFKSPHNVLRKDTPGNVEEIFEALFQHTTPELSKKYPLSCSAFLPLHPDYGMDVIGKQQDDRVDFKVFVWPTFGPQDNIVSSYVEWTMTNIPQCTTKPSAHILLQMRTALSHISGRPI